MNRRMTVLFLIGLSICTAAATAHSKSIQLIKNGNFEDGMTNWNYLGDVKSTDVGYPNMVDNFAGLGLLADQGPSLIWQQFDVSKVDKLTISFDWLFSYLDNSKGKYDEIIATYMQGDSDRVLFTKTVLDRKSKSSTLDEDSDDFSKSFKVSSAYGSIGTLVFELIEADGGNSRNLNNYTNSYLGIDNVSAVGYIPNPEPSTWLLMGIGLAGFTLTGLRRQRRVITPGV